MSTLGDPRGWPPDFSKYVFLARVLAKLPADIVWTRVQSGELKVAVCPEGITNFRSVLWEALNFQSVSSNAFANLDREKTLSKCQVVAGERERQPRWLYITRQSLKALSLKNECESIPNPAIPPVDHWFLDPKLAYAASRRRAKNRFTITQTIDLIRRETGVSIGAAQTLLIEALKAGVRFWHIQNYDTYLKEERIPPQTGHDAMLGDRGELIIAVSSSRAKTLWNVEIDSKDIRHYLDTLPKKGGDADTVTGQASSPSRATAETAPVTPSSLALVQAEGDGGTATEPEEPLKPLTSKTIPDFVKAYRENTANPTLTGETGIREAAKGRGNRPLIDSEFRRQMKDAGKPVKPGPRGPRLQKRAE
jgi:hypothetical protein